MGEVDNEQVKYKYIIDRLLMIAPTKENTAVTGTRTVQSNRNASIMKATLNFLIATLKRVKGTDAINFNDLFHLL